MLPREPMGGQRSWRPAVHRVMAEEVLRVQLKVVFWQAECIYTAGWWRFYDLYSLHIHVYTINYLIVEGEAHIKQSLNEILL